MDKEKQQLLNGEQNNYGGINTTIETPNTPLPPPQWLQMRIFFSIIVFLGLNIVYALRVNLSVAILQMATELNWDDPTQGILFIFDDISGIVLSSFFWGYIITQIPGGWLATQWGGKIILGAGIFGSSLFTILLPLAARVDFPLLMVTRVLTGFFEGVTYPALHNLVSWWFPEHERSRYLGFMWSGAYLGTILSLVLSPIIMHRFSWPYVFYFMGGAGILWTLLWQIFVTSVPEGFFKENFDLNIQVNRFMSKAEKNYIIATRGTPLDANMSVPWLKLLASVRVWAIVINHFSANWAFYILLTWMPSYLKNELHFDLNKSGFVALAPYLGCFIVAPIAGRIGDFMLQKGVLKLTVRKIFQSLATLLPALFLGLLCIKVEALVAVVFLVVSVASISFSVSGYGSNHLDIGPRFAGVLFGISNTGGTIPGIVGVYLTGYILGKTHSWSLVFLISSAVNIFGFFVFLFCSTSQLIFPYPAFLSLSTPHYIK